MCPWAYRMRLVAIGGDKIGAAVAKWWRDWHTLEVYTENISARLLQVIVCHSDQAANIVEHYQMERDQEKFPSKKHAWRPFPLKTQAHPWTNSI